MSIRSLCKRTELRGVVWIEPPRLAKRYAAAAVIPLVSAEGLTKIGSQLQAQAASIQDNEKHTTLPLGGLCVGYPRMGKAWDGFTHYPFTMQLQPFGKIAARCYDDIVY